MHITYEFTVEGGATASWQRVRTLVGTVVTVVTVVVVVVVLLGLAGPAAAPGTPLHGIDILTTPAALATLTAPGR